MKLSMQHNGNLGRLLTKPRVYSLLVPPLNSNCHSFAISLRNFLETLIINFLNVLRFEKVYFTLTCPTTKVFPNLLLCGILQILPPKKLAMLSVILLLLKMYLL
eukprot:Pompholyxophrys_punicea_v1_NODE_549_length_1706_cov_2.385827.p3 type:complete len:104 gc:universal NODE_549_length_1706_cov_2.385827:1248-1559(+)